MKKNYSLLKNISILFLVLIPMVFYGQVSQPYDSPGTYNFTVPAGVTNLNISVWGGGSGGNNNNSRGGGGGAFAGISSQTVIPGTVYTVVVGAGGAAGTGNSGQDSRFGSLVIAKGGNGAAGGLASASTGTIKFDGGNGGTSSSNGGAGGGGSAGAGGAGGTGGSTSSSTGADGGLAGLAGSGVGGASGGNGGNRTGSGADGGFPGGGGGEKGNSGSSSGAGGSGRVLITYTPAYLAQIISADTGSTTWCAGETRNVTVTIKNIGTQPWTDVKDVRDFNIGIKWNRTGTTQSWADYNVRTDAKNLEPGQTATYNFTITASEKPGAAYGNPLAPGTNNLAFDVVYEAVAWFGNNPAGTTGVGPGNNVFVTPVQTIVALPTKPTVGKPSAGVSTCAGTTTPLNATSGGNVIDWYTQPTGGVLVGTSNSGADFMVSPVANTTYYAEARNPAGCVSSSRTATALITVNNKPTVGTVAAFSALCAGVGYPSPAAPTVTTNGSPIISQGWEISTTGGSTFTAVTFPYTAAFADDGKLVRYTATNSCGTTVSNTVVLTVNDKPTLGPILVPSALCVGTLINPTAPTATANGSAVTTTRWELETAVGGGTYTTLNLPYAVNTADHGKRIRYYATNSCGTTYSNLATLVVNTSSQITVTKTEETCPGAKNGTINPVLSGGLSNVRYIKLTQKFSDADAWQQVQEIQAFEIFSGTNVALSTNGATATASSVYQNNANFGPDKAIDGDFNNPNANGFWHSNSTNVGEWIRVDLKAGKNVDYLRIYNRAGCCWFRGQNMLLELFDASDKLVYSKTVDLWNNQNVAGHYVEVNVLDVSWQDAATTLNRVGLGAGTYTLNWADAGGCSASLPVSIATANQNVTVSPASSIPTLCINTPLTPITHTTTGATGIGAATGLPVGVSASYSLNTITITGTPTASGTFNYSIPLTGGCGTAAATGTITVTANKTVTLTSASGTDSQTRCISTAITSITYATTGATGATVTGLPAGVTGTWAANVVTISGTPTASGTFSYTVTLTSGCGSNVTSGTITVVPVNTVTLTSAVNTDSQQICAATSIAPIIYTTTGATGIDRSGVSTGVNNLPAGVAATWFNNTITISGTPSVTGIYSYSIPLTGGCGSVSATGTIKVGETSTFNNGAWSSNGRPDGNGLNAVIVGSYSTSSGNIDACNCTIQTGGVLTVSTGTSVVIRNNLTNNGILTVESDGNLVQGLDVPVPPNSGTITVKRNIKFRNDDRQEYNYLISPVVGQTLKTIYPGVPTTSTYPYVLYHNEATNYFSNSSGAYIAARGLAVKEPSKAHVGGDNIDAVFQGAPGNGIFNYTLAFTNGVEYGYNLVGNPYPSNIDLQKLYILNGGSLTSTTPGKITSTFYFWDNRANDRYVQDGSNYSGRAYAVYNAYNDTGNAAGYLLNPEQILTANKPIKIAKVGQGFMVRATGAGSMIFNNSIRVADNSGASFFSKEAQNPVNRYWLRLVTPVKAVNTVAVVYFEGGSNAFGMDDSTLNADSSDMLYTLSDSRKLQIEGKPVFTVTDKVAVGSRHYATGNYTFALDKAEGIFVAGQPIYLKDKQTGIITDLTQGSYTFAANAGESTDRFEIIYQPETVLAADGTVKEELQVYRDGASFVVTAQRINIQEVELYDLSGRLLYKVQPNSTRAVIDSGFMVNGTYILKINHNGRIIVRKIIK